MEDAIPEKTWKVLVAKALADGKTLLDLRCRRGIDDCIDDAAATELAPMLKEITGLKVLRLRGKCVCGDMIGYVVI